MERISVCVVVVTYNRLEKLKKSLQCYEEQTILPNRIIVINNASSDGTREYLKEWIKTQDIFNKEVFNCEDNLGGAGGFAKGIEEATKYEDEFVFLADDDAYALPNMIEELQKFYIKYQNKNAVGALATSVISNENYCLGHRKITKKNLFFAKDIESPKEYYERESFEIDRFSFVGAMVKMKVAKEIGLPISEYFIHHDDIEYAARIRKHGYKIICVPKSIMIHDYKEVFNGFTWKDYYSARNSLDYYSNYFGKLNNTIYRISFYIRRCSFLSLVLKKRTRAEITMFKKAIKDADEKKLGVDEIYKPGINIESVS